MNGYIPIPTYFFPKYNFGDIKYIWHPKYKNTAYSEIESEETLSNDYLDATIGKPIIAKGVISNEEDDKCVAGVLVPDELDPYYSFFLIAPGFSTGVSGVFNKSNLKKIQFNESKDNISLNLYDHLLSPNNFMLDPLVSDINVNGKELTLNVAIFRKTAEKTLKETSNHKAKLLRLIAEPIRDEDWGFEQSETKLGKLLHKQLKKNGFEPAYQTSEIFPIISDGIIVNTSCEKIKDYEVPDIDNMENEKIIELIESFPWETWEVKVEVSDAAWIEHLKDSFKPFEFSTMIEREAQEWKGNLILTK